MKTQIMLDEDQVFVATFDKTHSRNMPFINNFLFLLVVTFSIGSIWYFSIKLKIKTNHLTSHRCFLLSRAYIFVLPVFPTSPLIFVLNLGSYLSLVQSSRHSTACLMLWPCQSRNINPNAAGAVD